MGLEHPRQEEAYSAPHVPFRSTGLSQFNGFQNRDIVAGSEVAALSLLHKTCCHTRFVRVLISGSFACRTNKMALTFSVEDFLKHHVCSFEKVMLVFAEQACDVCLQIRKNDEAQQARFMTSTNMNTNMMLCNVLMRCLRSLFTDVRKRRKRH